MAEQYLGQADVGDWISRPNSGRVVSFTLVLSWSADSAGRLKIDRV